MRSALSEPRNWLDAARYHVQRWLFFDLAQNAFD
jgi:hypothetical protein